MNTTIRRRLVGRGRRQQRSPSPVAAAVDGHAASAATTQRRTAASPGARLPKATSPALLWTGRVEGHRVRAALLLRPRRLRRRPRGAARSATACATSRPSRPRAAGFPSPSAGARRSRSPSTRPRRSRGARPSYAGWRTFRQLRSVGSFEGYTDYGLGVRARLPMRAFVLTDTDGGRRLVVDVAHQLVIERAVRPALHRKSRPVPERTNCSFDACRPAAQEPEPAFVKPAFSASSADLNQNSAIVWSYHWPSGSW